MDLLPTPDECATGHGRPAYADRIYLWVVCMMLTCFAQASASGAVVQLMVQQQFAELVAAEVLLVLLLARVVELLHVQSLWAQAPLVAIGLRLAFTAVVLVLVLVLVAMVQPSALTCDTTWAPCVSWYLATWTSMRRSLPCRTCIT